MKKEKDNSETIEVNLKDFFENLNSAEKSKDIDFERALSLGLLYSLKKFNKTSEQSKYDLKASAILGKSCKIMDELVNEIKYRKKDYKRKRSNEWKSIIKDISRNMKVKEQDSEPGFFSKMIHRN